MDQIRRDVRQALRALLKSPGFTLTALMTVALGVGVPTAMFTIVNGVVLRPLPYPDASRIVRVWSAHPERGLLFFSVSAPDAVDWAAQVRPFEAMGAFERPQPLAWTDGDQPDQLLVSRVTPEIFRVLAVPARIGRAFEATDGAGALVLSHALWQRRFGGAPDVIGRRLTLDGQAYTVTGVMPPRFVVPGTGAEAWLPLELRAGDDRSRRFLRVLGRVRPGTTVAAARTDLEQMASRLQALYPATNGGWSVTVRTVHEAIVGPDLRHALLTLLGIVGFILLIACANVAHLVLVRGAARHRELAIRAALGAGRRRLMVELLAESALIAIVGGAAGVLLAGCIIEGLRVAGPAVLPLLEDVRLDARVLAFAAGVSLIAGALFGVVPAVQASRTQAMERSLRGGRGIVGFGGARVSSAIVGLEVALAVVVTIGSMLLVRSLLRLQAVEPGFEAKGVTVVPLLPGERPAGGPSVGAFYEAVLGTVRALPGVQEASFVSSAPFSGPNSANIVCPEGQACTRDQAPDADFRVVGPGYFRALHLPLRGGKDFDWQDRAATPPVAIVNEAMAARLWPGQAPVGRRFRVGDLESGPWLTVIGLAGNALYRELDAREARPMFYLPHAQKEERAMTLVVRSAAGSPPLAPALRQAVWGVDRSVPVPSVTGLEAALSDALGDRRFNASVFVSFAFLAVVLSAIGVYGVMAQVVSLRRTEIGLRMALGATRGSVAAFVLRRGGTAAAAGIVAGIGGALLLGPVLRSLLYGVGPDDPATIAAAAGLFCALIAVAAWGPARRATRFDPALILREG